MTSWECQGIISVMRKVLCPICGNVIRFNESEKSLICEVCRSAIKIKIHNIDDKQNSSETDAGMPREQLYSGDEIITAELDNSVPEPKQDLKTNLYNALEKTKTSRDNVAKKHEEQIGDSSFVFGNAHGDSEHRAEAQITFEAVAYQNSKEPQNAVPAAKDEDLKWIKWADIECESELLEDIKITKPSEVAKSKKNVKTPLNYRLAYVPFYAICTFISLIVLLYTPFLQINGDNYSTVYGAKLIGELFSVNTFLTDIFLLRFIAGVLLAAMVLSSAAYLVFAFRSYGEYNEKILKKSFMFSLINAGLTILIFCLFCIIVSKMIPNYDSIKMLYSGTFIAVPLQIYSVAANSDKMPKYRDEKKVLLSPKSTRRKAYILLGISMFFVWSLIFNTVISLGSNIAYNVIHSVTNGTSNILPKLSALSMGAFGVAFSFVWSGSINVVSATANYLIYSYIQYATLAATVLLIVVYARYAGKTAGIFLDEIKPKGNENVLLENEIKELNLAKFLKKSSSLSFIVYAITITLDVVGYVVLYSGTSNLIPALFTMIAFVIAALIRRYPYAVLAREQYMKAYVEYEEMAADIPPMTKKQRSSLERTGLLAALFCSAAFVIYVLV